MARLASVVEHLVLLLGGQAAVPGAEGALRSGPTLGPQGPWKPQPELPSRAGGLVRGGPAIGGGEGQKTVILRADTQKAVLETDAPQVCKSSRRWG